MTRTDRIIIGLELGLIAVLVVIFVLADHASTGRLWTLLNGG